MLCLGGFELYSRWVPLKKRSREEISCKTYSEPLVSEFCMVSTSC